MTAKRSEATPTIMGSVSASTPAVATAASIAFPPRIRTWRPACAASGWLVTTIPFAAMTSERLCAGQPEARTPRTARQKGGAGARLHHGSVTGVAAVADAVVGADCASLRLGAPTKASIRPVATNEDRSRRIINLPSEQHGQTAVPAYARYAASSAGTVYTRSFHRDSASQRGAPWRHQRYISRMWGMVVDCHAGSIW